LLRDPPPDPGRGGRRRGGPARAGQRGRPPRALPRPHRRVQVPEADLRRRDDPAHRDREDPASGRRRGARRARPVRAVVVGAGAIGAYVGARLARAGQDVTLFARGAQLRALAERGIRVRAADGDFEVRPAVADRLEAIGPADVVFLGVKAHSLPDLAPRLAPLLGPDTVVVSMQNGLPWWFVQGFGGDLEGLRLEQVDPGGAVAAAIAPRRIGGATVYVSAELEAPGVVRHHEGARISLGEPDGSQIGRASCREREWRAVG